MIGNNTKIEILTHLQLDPETIKNLETQTDEEKKEERKGLPVAEIKRNDLVDFEVHPVLTEEGVGPVVEALMARHQ